MPHAVRLFLWATLAFALASGVTLPAPAQSHDIKQRAREHFDRGLRLFDQSDDKGALAEFRAAYELIPHPSVLYSIGLVHASLGRPVDAVDALERLFGQGPKLAADQIERAKATLAAERAKIGSLSVATNVSAAVEVDGVDAGRTPIAKPLRVASGIRLVTVVAPGHAPIRREVSVASGQLVTLRLELTKSEQELAQLELAVDVMDAEVLVDGERIGKSPLPMSLALVPGRRVIEVRRPGYRPFRRALDVAPGSRGSVSVKLEADEADVARSGGTLLLALSEEQAVVFVDGRLRSGAGPFPLAPGRHRVRIEKGEFFPVERDVNVDSGRRAVLKIALSPTPEKRAAYVDAATKHRTISWITVGAGAAVAVTGGAFWVLNQKKKADNQDSYDEKIATCEQYSPASSARVACTEEAVGYLDRKDELGKADWAWGGIAGAGVLAAGTGIALLLTGDDPHRFDLKPESDVFGKLRLRPTATPRGDVGMWLSGAF